LQTPRARSILAASKLRIGQGLRTEKVRSWRNSSHCICPRCRNFPTQFDWRRLAVSSSVFSHDTPASGVFRTSSTELERKTDPDDEDIVVPSLAAIGIPAAEPHEGRIPFLPRVLPSPYLSPLAQFPWAPIPPHLMRFSHWRSQQLPQREAAPNTSSTRASLSSGVARESDARSYLAQRHVLTRRIPCAERVTQRSQ
jgi:hypothetical protein